MLFGCVHLHIRAYVRLLVYVWDGISYASRSSVFLTTSYNNNNNNNSNYWNVEVQQQETSFPGARDFISLLDSYFVHVVPGRHLVWKNIVFSTSAHRRILLLTSAFLWNSSISQSSSIPINVVNFVLNGPWGNVACS